MDVIVIAVAAEDFDSAISGSVVSWNIVAKDVTPERADEIVDGLGEYSIVIDDIVPTDG